MCSGPCGVKRAKILCRTSASGSLSFACAALEAFIVARPSRMLKLRMACGGFHKMSRGTSKVLPEFSGLSGCTRHSRTLGGQSTSRSEPTTPGSWLKVLKSVGKASNRSSQAAGCKRPWRLLDCSPQLLSWNRKWIASLWIYSQ